MNAIFLIAKRDFASYFQGLTGYAIIAVLLLVDGLIFQGIALGGREQLSSQVLSTFFLNSHGVTFAAGILLTMRLLAEEQHDGTIVLLFTAPIVDWQIVLGKWLAGVWVVLIFIALTAYMPFMIFANGSVHLGHVAAGYLGLVLTGFAAVAIGLLASALTKHQVLAAVSGAAIGIGFTFLNWIAKKVDGPFDEVFAYLSMYDKHFLASFSKGAIHTQDIVFFLSITFFFLLGTRQVLGARRWR